MSKIDYFKRIISAYLTREPSQLTFWHGIPDVNLNVDHKVLGEYYQLFDQKADYQSYFDDKGVILLDYRGKIGKQHYPIAIAQYGLACFNRYKRTGEGRWLNKARIQGDWLVEHLLRSEKGCYLWYANFDWEYRDLLKAPWPSALAQGNGISLLARLFREAGDRRYLEAAEKAYKSLITQIADGGVAFVDPEGDLWLEEYIVDPPTHILNGFMWSMMGVYDFYLLTGREDVRQVFDRCVKALTKNLNRFDTGFWSLYELSGTRMKMFASGFYHALHIAQLEILFRITGTQEFHDRAQRWSRFGKNFFFKLASQSCKAVFKVIYY